MNNLPQGWLRRRLGEVLSLNYGRSLPAKSRVFGSYPVYGSNGIVGYHNLSLVAGPCIIVGRKGSIGEVHFFESDCWPIDTTYFINDFSICDSSFTKYLLKSLGLASMNRATAIPGLNREDVYSIEIALPPFAEQRRISAKIDILISKLERAQFHIDHILSLGEKYKQAILADGFSGKWTTGWRIANGDGNQLNGDNGIPNSWKVQSLGDIAEIQTGLTLGKKRKPTEITKTTPYLRVANVQRGYLNLSEVKYVQATTLERQKLRLIKGDILMNEGGDRDKLGRGWVWDDEIENCIHQNHVFRVRLKDKRFPSKWISYFTNEFGQKYFFDKGQQTTNLASISKTKVAASDILEAQRLFELSHTDKAKRTEFVRVLKLIQRSISKEAVYSGEMRYLLRGQRSDKHPWMQQLLEI